MGCEAQANWSETYNLKEYRDYHRHSLLVALEFSSLLVIMVAAVIANFATVVTIFRTPSLKEKLGNWLIINLCVMDLITALGSMAFSLVDILMEGYLLCVPWLCTIHGCLAVIGVFGNFATIVMVALHRFLGVVAVNRITLNKRHIWLMIAGCWAFAIGILIPPVVGSSKSVYSHGTHHCSPAWARSCAYFVVCVAVIYAITIPLMIVCYSAIYWKVRKSGKRLEKHQDGKTKARKYVNGAADTKDQSDDRSVSDVTRFGAESQSVDSSLTDVTRFDDVAAADRPVERPAETRVARGVGLDQSIAPAESCEQTSGVGLSISSQLDDGNDAASKPKRVITRVQDVDIRIALAGALLVVTTAVCWTPYFVVNSCTRTTQSSHAVRILAMWFGYMNSALDPIIYSLLNRKLRSEKRKQLRRLWTFLVNISR